MPAEDGKDGVGIIVVALCGAGFFAILAWAAFYMLRQFPYANICVDEQGIWPAHLPKEQALVPWHSINKIKDRRVMQRLDLMDAMGKRLIKIEYQLLEFLRLRQLVFEKTRQEKVLNLPVTYEKRPLHHHSTYALSIMFLLLGGFLVVEEVYIGFIAVLVIYWIVEEYLQAVYKVVLHDGYMLLFYPRRTIKVEYEKIRSIDEVLERFPHIELVLHDDQHYSLQQLGIDDQELLQILHSITKKV